MARTVRRSENALAVTLHEDEQLVFDALANADDEPSVAAASGLSLAQVRHLVERLAMMGAVVFTSAATAEDGLAESDEDVVALGPVMRARINELYSTLDSVDYYTLLGVNRAATQADIRRAYHKLAPEFHPDRYFRKNLGEYKNKIEKVFARVTKAHDTLRYKKRRRAYDDSASNQPPDSAPRAAPEPSDQGSAASDAAAGRRQAQTHPHAPPSVSPAGRAVVEAHGAEAMARTRRLRRAALARKLGAGRGADHRKRRPESEDSGYQSIAGVEQSAAERLREHFDEAGRRARDRRAERFVRDGDRAVDQGDFAGAHEAYTNALELRPGDDMLSAKIDEMGQKVAK